MSAQIFIDKLEASNLLDAAVINKLRSKVARPGKTPPAQSVAKYCLEKGLLTKAQAERLLQSVAREATSVPDDSDVLQAEQPAQPTMLSAADLVVEDDDVETVQPVAEVQPLTAEATLEPVEPVAELGGDPLAAPAVPLSTEDPLAQSTATVGTEGDTTGGEPAAEGKSKAFSGKKIQEQSFESRWIILGSASLVILLLLGWFFATVIMKGNSDEVFREAEELFASESYPAAVDAYKEFIKLFKSDPNAKYAHVKFRVAEMKIAASGKDVKNTVNVFQDNIEKITLVMADQIDDRPFEEEIRSMIALDTITAAQKAANAAATQPTVEEKEAALNDAKDMMRLVNDGKFVPRAERELPSFASMIEATEATLNSVQYSITQEKDTVQALADATAQIDAGETYQAFQIYDQLVTKHPSADADQRVIDVVLKISDKEQSLARQLDPLAENLQDVDATLPAAVEGRVTLATATGESQSGLDGQFGAYLVDGAVYGVDVGQGRLIWRHYVGYETEIEPVWLEDPRRVLISDQKNHRLRLVEPETGKTVWHKSVGEPFLAPTVSGNKIFVSMHSGKVARIDSETGDLAAIVQLPQRLTVPCTSNLAGNVLYQLGEHLNLYVLSASLSDISCVQAFYVGHRDGTIRVPPILLQGALIVPVNVDANTCELRLLNNVPDKMELKVAGETHELNSNITKPMKVFGNYLVTVTINGDVEVLELDARDDVFSLATVAKQSLNLPPTQEIFYAAANGKIWIATQGIVQYAVVVAKQKIQDQSVANNADYFVGELEVFENLLVHRRKRSGSQMVSLAGVHPDRLTEVWRLDIGGGLAGAPLVDNESVTAINSQGDFYRLDDQALTAEISHQPIHRASRTQQNLVFTRSVTFPDGGSYVLGPRDRKDSISYIPSNEVLPVSLSEVDTNGLEITSDPVRFRNGVLIGLNNGEIRLVVPRSPQDDAIFVPQAEVGDEFLWQRPCPLSPDTFVVANRDGRIFSVRFVPNEGSPYLGQILEAKAATKIIGPVVTNGKMVFTATEGPNGNEVLAIDPADLKIKGTYSLGGIGTWGPEAVGDLALATTSDGDLVAFGDSITEPLWTIKLPHGRATGQPLSWNGKIIVTLKDGQVAVIEPDGSNVTVIDTREPILGPSSLAGSRLFVSGADSTVCVVDLAKME